MFVLTLVQVATPHELRGRVLALTLALASAAAPLGMILGGVLGEWSGMELPIAFGISGLGAFAVSVIGTAQPACRSFLALDLIRSALGGSLPPATPVADSP